MDTGGLERVERFRINRNERKFASQKNTLTYTIGRILPEKESQLYREHFGFDARQDITVLPPIEPQNRTLAQIIKGECIRPGPPLSLEETTSG
jgi:hypothetical protein